MIDLAHLRSLAAVLDDRGFATAAARLGLSQPTVSQHIRKLEARLGVPLVLRGRGGCRPTPEGAAVRSLAASVLRLHDRILAAVGGRRFVVGASSNIGIYLLQPAIAAYRGGAAAAPELVIDNNPEIARRLEAGEIDLALMEWWDGRPGFAARAWREEAMVVILPPAHPLAAEAAIPVDRLRKLALLGGEPGTGTGRLLRGVFGDAMPPVELQLGSTEAVKRAVMAGLGVSLVLAGTVREEVRHGLIAARPLAGVALEKPLYLVHPQPSARMPEIAELARALDTQ